MLSKAPKVRRQVAPLIRNQSNCNWATSYRIIYQNTTPNAVKTVNCEDENSMKRTNRAKDVNVIDIDKTQLAIPNTSESKHENSPVLLRSQVPITKRLKLDLCRSPKDCPLIRGNTGKLENCPIKITTNYRNVRGQTSLVLKGISSVDMT